MRTALTAQISHLSLCDYVAGAARAADVGVQVWGLVVVIIVNKSSLMLPETRWILSSEQDLVLCVFRVAGVK